ncbi:hypothetical protein SAMN05446037_102058 [Anaerovirgula multivorans]|uniref:Uncharacterized protein n=1 Tax=Anaerovirgula multivorans TaxID=312168 RepID=A0A239H950_9FIRM|nr:hypothetical protein [Anaerovirgula multivorans]SNS77343.1 hypothetical protein SAMN05446037_102058 [Anaerovirgula multivorans]
MAKANNPRLQAQVTPELKEITDKMLEHLDMSQAQFFEKYLPALFLAIDRGKYLELLETVYGNEELNRLIKTSERLG